MKAPVIFICIFLLTCSMNCQENSMHVLKCGLRVPNNKIWAHRVNDTLAIHDKENQFGGMELDIIYSPYQDQLFVCHNDSDTINSLSLDLWLTSISHILKNTATGWMSKTSITTTPTPLLLALRKSYSTMAS
ncbi:MAG: hypothetical protein ACTTKO_00620 [Candidatus Limimorpha sp.]